MHALNAAVNVPDHTKYLRISLLIMLSAKSQIVICIRTVIKSRFAHFNGHFLQVNLSYLVLLELRMMEVVVTTGAISRAKFLSDHHRSTEGIK